MSGDLVARAQCRVAVLHARRRRGVHRARVALPFLHQVPEPVVGLVDLVDDRVKTPPLAWELRKFDSATQALIRNSTFST